MKSGHSEGQQAAGQPQGESFSAALRSAIASSGLSLDRIQARLQQRGVPVSVTALSYWQSGKRQPERQSSISAVGELEQILDLPSGALLGLLSPPRPRGAPSRNKRRRTQGQTMTFPRDVLQPLLARIGAPYALEQHHKLSLVGLHDRCDIAEDGGQRAVTARCVFQANADGQDRWLLVYKQGNADAGAPALHALRNCEVGRSEIDLEHGLTVAELLFDRPINRGETHLIEYSITNEGPPFPECQNTHYREFRSSIREYLLEIRFDEGHTPAKCWQYERRNHGDLAERKELTVDNSGGVHAVALDFGPGVFGIDWDYGVAGFAGLADVR